MEEQRGKRNDLEREGKWREGSFFLPSFLPRTASQDAQMNEEEEKKWSVIYTAIAAVAVTAATAA